MVRTAIKHSVLAAILVCLASVTAFAQDWQLYQVERYKVKFSLPKTWSCVYEKDASGAEVVVGRNPDQTIKFRIHSRPLTSSNELPDDPDQRKEFIEAKFREMIDKSDASKVNISTDVAVENVNNLLGVITDFRIVVPAKDELGNPILKSTGALILVAKRGKTYYYASIECPLNKFTYNSLVMNRIMHSISAYDPAEEAAVNAVNAISGIWQLTFGAEIKYDGTLLIEPNRAAMRTRWLNGDSTPSSVDQQMSLQITSQGLLLVGSNPVIAGTLTPAPRYTADKILFQKQTDGSFKAWTRDDVNIKEWMPITVKSYVSQRDLNAMSGRWELTMNGHPAVLTMRGAFGVLSVTMNDGRVVEQQVSMQSALQSVRLKGLLLTGANPVLAGTKTIDTRYTADQLIFQQQANGSFSVWTRDGVNVKDWTVVTVKSHIRN